jgi:coproporphyrinogen III oxidase-like Fe-S oxidoreductase
VSADSTSYWNGDQWWDAGSRAHGFLGATRWWNVKHARIYAHMLAKATLSVPGFEQLDTDETHNEGVLRTRLRQGLSLGMLDTAKRQRAVVAVVDGLLKSEGNRLVLADRGRLLGDAVIRTLLA